ncbi:MAG: sulfatase [Algibacter sp.]|uniref:sulfatase n=1 Tax=Algibacter sp. TaxID=1872428 RepID=UPI00262F554E|nr:sulfatase [Algibacter sp.]MDG1729335.1 sulfatase [Algibacter sp.]MDG2179054.1 sulfatase [Algibacter sp.]
MTKSTLKKISFILVYFLMLGCKGTNVKGKETANSNDKPNIIFFMVDDMGWMDSEVYGSEYYETPNINRLANMGMRFTRAYAANALCSPTRGSILTGSHPGRYGLTSAAGHLPPNPNKNLEAKRGAPWMKVACPTSSSFMPLEEFTLPEALKTNGYTTAHIGKWHLGHEEYWPEHQGFDINIGGGHHPGPPNFFSPYNISTLPDKKDKEYITDRITDEAITFIENHKDKPFYLNFWQFAVHAPFQAPLSLIDKYKKKKDPRGMQKNPIMGGMIEKMDESLGRMLDKLEELKIMENTIIVFFSDNGGNMYNIVNGEYPTNNYPLSYGKANIHEGGVRVPCIVVWNGKIKPNTTSNEMIQSIDFYPTLLEATNTKVNPNQIVDGISILNHLKSSKPLERKAIYSHFPHYFPVTHNVPSTAVWYENYKLIKEYGEGENRTNGFKLYDLSKDIGEKNDISNKYPELVEKLKVMIENHIIDIGGLLPIKNPNYNPNAESRMGIQSDFPIEKYPSY